MRLAGTPFTTLPDGRVSTQLELRIENRSGGRASYTISLIDAPDLQVMSPTGPVTIEADATSTVLVVAIAPASSFRGDGDRAVTVRVSDGGGFTTDLPATVFGPEETR